MNQRRQFIRNLSLGGAFAVGLPTQFAQAITSSPGKKVNANDQIRIALIGKGSMGTADMNTALSVSGTKIVAVCDLYDQRLKDASKSWGDELFLTKDYREILDRKDVDAVIVATPDHWHQAIATDAMKAGKHVYCEKPVIHSINEINGYLDTRKKTKSIFQVGSQGMASLGNRKAAQLLQAGAIGRLNLIEASFTAPPNPTGIYSFPPDASPSTIDWKRFLGNAPKKEFDPQRFFYWRNWFDYGTGIAGDLFVHVFSSLHSITGSPGPSRIYASGDTVHYNDGFRDTPDLMLGLYDYALGTGGDKFKVSLSANMADGVSKQWGSMNFKLIGNKGTLEVGWDQLTLKTSSPLQNFFFDDIPLLNSSIDIPNKVNELEWIFKAEPNYKGGHYDHFANFFEAIRTGQANKADLLFGLQSAAPAVLSNLSFTENAPVYWDPIQLKIIS